MVTPLPPVLRLDGASGRSCRRHLRRPETRSSAPPLRVVPVDPSGCFCQSPRRTPPGRRRVFPMRSLYNLFQKCLCLFPCDGITGKCRKKTRLRWALRPLPGLIDLPFPVLNSPINFGSDSPDQLISAQRPTLSVATRLATGHTVPFPLFFDFNRGSTLGTIRG